MDARLIIDPPARGSWNMAVDEALFQIAQHSRRTTLRFYEWSVPTLSLGYFQQAGDRQSHPSSRECPVVRRSTGGGAIVHDRELTYSLVTPIADDRAATSQHLVQIIHAAFIEVLNRLGIAATRQGSQAVRDSRAAIEPFLCFQRRTAEDVIVGEHKVAGSAQRRLYGTLLQHGSVLLGQSEAAPELPGLSEIAGKDVSLGQLRDAWSALLGESLHCCFVRSSRSQDEDRLADGIEQAKYAANQWNLKR